MHDASSDGLCSSPHIVLRAHQLPATVCVAAGVNCPLIRPERAHDVLERVGGDPTLTIRLTSTADELPHYRRCTPGNSAPSGAVEVFNRKRDLDVLQRLGLVPGAVRRARYLYMLLFERIASLDGLCAWDTEQWSGCEHARGGAYESVRERGWQAIVAHRSDGERTAARGRSAKLIAQAGRLFVRPHHLMCLCCWYGATGGTQPRPNDTIWELFQRIRRDPDVPIVLVEGCCMVCDCCDGFHPETGRCVHDCGLIRDYKKDLDVFQKLGLMPGAALPARALFDRLFERIPCVRDICAYGDGVVTSREWNICGSAVTGDGYAKARESGVFGPAGGIGQFEGVPHQ